MPVPVCFEGVSMKRFRILIPIILILVLLSGYLIFAFADIPFVAALRRTYVETAMGTMNHQWLATSLLPKSAVERVVAEQQQARNKQVGVQSTWMKDERWVPVSVNDRESFFEAYHEIIPAVFDQWIMNHPHYRDTDWSGLCILPGESDGLFTRYGEPVVAIDVPNMILLVEVKTSASKGILAIGKDPSRLSIRPSAGLGEYGETVGAIADRNGGVLAITGGAFHGANDAVPGSELAGYAMCDGVAYGDSHLPAGNKRIELHENDLLQITDSNAPVGDHCTDAAEFRPALIIDGELLVEQGWAGMQPRVCLGQSDRYEILMLVVEGRILSDGIVGASILECAQLLQKHNAMQAINLDGGNSAILWYNGEYLTRCCDPDHPQGRPVPTAVIYG